MLTIMTEKRVWLRVKAVESELQSTVLSRKVFFVCNEVRPPDLLLPSGEFYLYVGEKEEHFQITSENNMFPPSPDKWLSERGKLKQSTFETHYFYQGDKKYSCRLHVLLGHTQGRCLLEIQNQRDGSVVNTEQDADMETEDYGMPLEPPSEHLPCHRHFEVGTPKPTEDAHVIKGDLVVEGRLVVLSDEETKTELQEIFTRDIPRVLLHQFSQVKTFSFVDKWNQVHELGFSAQNLHECFGDQVVLDLKNGTKVVNLAALMAKLSQVVQCLIDSDQKKHEQFALLGQLSDISVIRHMLEVKADLKTDPPKNLSSLHVDNTVVAGKVDWIKEGEEVAKALNEPESNWKYIATLCKNIGLEEAHRLKNLVLKSNACDGKTAGGRFIKLAKAANVDKTSRTNSQRKEKSRDDPFSYQLEAVQDVGFNNAMLVFPTGMGKTLMSTMVAKKVLEAHGGIGTVLFVCQDRALTTQQCEYFAEQGLDTWKVGCVMGGGVVQEYNRIVGGLKSWNNTDLGAQGFCKLLSDFQVMVVTAGYLNNLLEHTLDVSMIKLLVMDEVHHAGEGKHNYVSVVRYFRDRHPSCQLLGMSASVVTGTCNEDKLHQDLASLQKSFGDAKLVRGDKSSTIPFTSVLLHNPQDADEYVECAFNRVIGDLVNLAREFLFPDSKIPPSADHQDYGEKFISWAKNMQTRHKNEKNDQAVACFFALSQLAALKQLVDNIGAICAKNTVVALYLVSFSTFGAANEAVELMWKSLLTDILQHIPPSFSCRRVEHVVELLLSDPTKQVLIRAKTQQGVYWLAHELRNRGIVAQAVVGRGNMSSSKTLQYLKDFKAGKVQVLVATSLMEEGVDLKECDLVISYGVDGVISSGKSLVQNAGRARKKNAEFLVLCKNLKETYSADQKQDQVHFANKVVQEKANQRSL